MTAQCPVGSDGRGAFRGRRYWSDEADEHGADLDSPDSGKDEAHNAGVSAGEKSSDEAFYAALFGEVRGEEVGYAGGGAGPAQAVSACEKPLRSKVTISACEISAGGFGRRRKRSSSNGVIVPAFLARATFLAGEKAKRARPQSVQVLLLRLQRKVTPRELTIVIQQACNKVLWFVSVLAAEQSLHRA